jgi:hypothetical protein
VRIQLERFNTVFGIGDFFEGVVNVRVAETGRQEMSA